MLQSLHKAKKLPPGFPPEKYHAQWLGRAWAHDALTREGVTMQLGDMTMAQFQPLFPDQNNYLRLLRSSSNQKVRELFKQLKYSGEPQHFSMWACLCLCTEAREVDFHWVEEHVGPLRQLARQYQQKHGLMPHPGAFSFDAICAMLS